MSDDGATKDDVKVPDGEVGDKIEKLFRVDEKDASKTMPDSVCLLNKLLMLDQT